MRYLVDMNVCILAIAGREPDASFLKKAIRTDAVALSVITVAEFLTRAARDERRAFESLVQAFPMLLVDETAARVAAQYRKKFLHSTRTHLLDCFIAAQAKVHGLALVTNNRKNFPMRDIEVVSPRSA